MRLTPAEHALVSRIARGMEIKVAARDLGIKYAAAQRRLEIARRTNDAKTTFQLLYRYGIACRANGIGNDA